MLYSTFGIVEEELDNSNKEKRVLNKAFEEE